MNQIDSPSYHLILVIGIDVIDAGTNPSSFLVFI